ncbi:MAG: hypothetical protein MI741_15480 [Rhodospirillales bacterium]|nr:hypothetical protein [Rhodospirillales bacterium]
MKSDATELGLSRNVRLYPWYAGVFHAHFWMPIFFLYFLRHMELVDGLRAVSEVPLRTEPGQQRRSPSIANPTERFINHLHLPKSYARVVNVEQNF